MMMANSANPDQSMGLPCLHMPFCRTITALIAQDKVIIVVIIQDNFCNRAYLVGTQLELFW